jgi:hypothetical protein
MFATCDLSTLADLASLVLIPGIVETSKKLWFSGNTAPVLSLVRGAVFASLAEGINLGIMPKPALPWIRVAVMGEKVTGASARRPSANGECTFQEASSFLEGPTTHSRIFFGVSCAPPVGATHPRQPSTRRTASARLQAVATGNAHRWMRRPSSLVLRPSSVTPQTQAPAFLGTAVPATGAIAPALPSG